MSVTVQAAETITINEALPNNTSSASDANRTVIHSLFNTAHNLSSTSSPAATLQASFVMTLTAGAATIDFRALTGSNGATVDGNGLRAHLFRFTNLGSNPMTIVQGASNALQLMGATFSITVPAGGTVQFYGAGGNGAIDATHKTIDVTGTGAQTAQVTVVLG